MRRVFPSVLIVMAILAFAPTNGVRRLLEFVEQDQLDGPCNCNVRKLNDPYWKDSWHLLNETPPSMKIIEAWDKGFTGKGVVVTVVDDGLDYRHPDLINNYDPAASYDINDGDSDPTPRPTYTNENRHGTRMAGIISATANNEVCSVGVAPKSTIGGIRLLDGNVDDDAEAVAFSFANDHIDIYAIAFGPDDDGKTVDGPGPKAMEAIERAIKMGRNGKGSIIVSSTGNGGRYFDDCNCDGYSNSIYTIGVGSITSNSTQPWYGEKCSSMLAATYSSGGTRHKEMTTTDLNSRCTTKHTGNSPSVSIAAGMCALALEANPYLTWRDMQHLIVQTANPYGLKVDDWITNAVGRKVSRTFGYGLMDADAMVTKARNWTHVPKQVSCRVTVQGSEWYVNNNRPTSVQIPTFPCEDGGILPDRLEHVVLKINTHKIYQLGLLSIHLESPSHTRSTIVGERTKIDNRYRGFLNWNFTSVQFWDENPVGDWVVIFERKNYVAIRSPIVLTLHGTLDKDWEKLKPRPTSALEAPVEDETTDKTITGTSIDPEEENKQKLLRDMRYIACKTGCHIQSLFEPDKPCNCVF
uniref:furin-1-like n=1 Tax=Styela clava TaxID=7725 RepID=UPI001939EA03|nr:furin-1-like [Styela clava]